MGQTPAGFVLNTSKPLYGVASVPHPYRGFLFLLTMKTYFIQAFVKFEDRYEPMLYADIVQANSYCQAITMFYDVVKVHNTPTSKCWAQITTINEITYVEQ